MMSFHPFLISFIILTLSSGAQSQNLPESMETQCRSEAKEIALKSYQSCVSVKKTEQIENLRKEYQARLLEIKNEYDQKIKELSATTKLSDNKSKKEVISSEQDMQPTIKLKKAKNLKKNKKNTNPPVQVETQSIPEEVVTARIHDELNAVTGEVEKLNAQDMEDPTLNIQQ